MKQTMLCKNCFLPIERSQDAACGWRHTKSQRVMCLLDATPLNDPTDSIAERERKARMDKACEKPENWHLRIVRGFAEGAK